MHAGTRLLEDGEDTLRFAWSSWSWPTKADLASKVSHNTARETTSTDARRCRTPSREQLTLAQMQRPC